MLRTVLIFLLVIAAISGLNALYIVKQYEQALVLQFGDPVRVVKEPGLHFKLPFLQNVEVFDKRILDLNADPKELIASDQKRVIVDSFAKYRITDPLKFYQTVRSISQMEARLNKIMDSRLRKVIGEVPLSTLLTEERSAVMNDITKNVAKESESFGIEVVDVRMMRADLPQKNSQAIYRRMQTEREREAKEFRAQGAEEAQRITSRADREVTVLVAEAQKKSEILRGEGEAESTRIFAEAFSRDESFYAFYRSMQAYREALKKEDTTMVLSPDSEFLQFFGDITGAGK